MKYAIIDFPVTDEEFFADDHLSLDFPKADSSVVQSFKHQHRVSCKGDGNFQEVDKVLAYLILTSYINRELQPDLRYKVRVPVVLWGIDISQKSA